MWHPEGVDGRNPDVLKRKEVIIESVVKIIINALTFVLKSLL